MRCTSSMILSIISSSESALEHETDFLFSFLPVSSRRVLILFSLVCRLDPHPSSRSSSEKEKDFSIFSLESISSPRVFSAVLFFCRAVLCLFLLSHFLSGKWSSKISVSTVMFSSWNNTIFIDLLLVFLITSFRERNTSTKRCDCPRLLVKWMIFLHRSVSGSSCLSVHLTEESKLLVSNLKKRKEKRRESWEDRKVGNFLFFYCFFFLHFIVFARLLCLQSQLLPSVTVSSQLLQDYLQTCHQMLPKTSVRIFWPDSFVTKSNVNELYFWFWKRYSFTTFLPLVCGCLCPCNC